MDQQLTRRELLRGASVAAGLVASGPARLLAAGAPTAPVAVARCRSYGSELMPALERMFDQLGGLGRLAKNKTVAIKVNLTGGSFQRLGHLHVGRTVWTHPAVLGTTVALMGRAGARRIRILESPWSTAMPLEEFMLQANWEPMDFVRAAPKVEFENTNWLGSGKKYSRLAVPRGGHIYPAIDFNHSYEDCDLFVSLAKFKEHGTTGVTLAMKNCFGSTPCTIYGDGAGFDEPSPVPVGGRGAVFHRGERPPSKSAPQENNPSSPRDDKYRVPRIVADIVAARPIGLAIIDGVESMAGGEGAWIPGTFSIQPSLLVAGANAVCTDAVATALMGFDPMADRGAPPFELCDSTLRLAEELGAGTRDLRRIEVAGAPLREAVFDFRAARRVRGGKGGFPGTDHLPTASRLG